MPVSDAACCFRIANATASIWDARRATPRHSIGPAPGRPAAKDHRWDAARCKRWGHLAGRRRAQVRSMNLPFARRRQNRPRRDYYPDYCTIGFLMLGFLAGPVRAASNDYPTSARADYVIGCMAANGNTREALLKCSCAIDTIASLMPYSHYEQAETALGLQAGGGVGGRVGLFRDPP